MVNSSIYSSHLPTNPDIVWNGWIAKCILWLGTYFITGINILSLFHHSQYIETGAVIQKAPVVCPKACTIFLWIRVHYIQHVLLLKFTFVSKQLFMWIEVMVAVKKKKKKPSHCIGLLFSELWLIDSYNCSFLRVGDLRYALYLILINYFKGKTK